MALRGDRQVIQTDISYTLNDVAAPGVVLCFSTQGSGMALGDMAGLVTLHATGSGQVVAGVLLNNFVNINQTLYHRNFHKDEHVIGERCTILRKGWVVTDKVTGTPALGNKAYLTANGVVTPTLGTGGIVGNPLVGTFGGAKDEDGYVKLEVNLPNGKEGATTL